MKASTISVLLTGSTSIHMYIAHKRDTANVSVRFDQGDAATVCGFPQAWGIHDYPVAEFDRVASEFVYNDEVEEGAPFKIYVSPEDEIKILKAAERGIKRQMKDPMFTDYASTEFRQQCTHQIQAAIKRLATK